MVENQPEESPQLNTGPELQVGAPEPESPPPKDLERVTLDELIKEKLPDPIGVRFRIERIELEVSPTVIAVLIVVIVKLLGH